MPATCLIVDPVEYNIYIYCFSFGFQTFLLLQSLRTNSPNHRGPILFTSRFEMKSTKKNSSVVKVEAEAEPSGYGALAGEDIIVVQVLK